MKQINECFLKPKTVDCKIKCSKISTGSSSVVNLRTFHWESVVIEGVGGGGVDHTEESLLLRHFNIATI